MWISEEEDPHNSFVPLSLTQGFCNNELEDAKMCCQHNIMLLFWVQFVNGNVLVNALLPLAFNQISDAKVFCVTM